MFATRGVNGPSERLRVDELYPIDSVLGNK
jgi:hypothetical protein